MAALTGVCREVAEVISEWCPDGLEAVLVPSPWLDHSGRDHLDILVLRGEDVVLAVLVVPVGGRVTDVLPRILDWLSDGVEHYWVVELLGGDERYLTAYRLATVDGVRRLVVGTPQRVFETQVPFRFALDLATLTQA